MAISAARASGIEARGREEREKLISGVACKQHVWTQDPSELVSGGAEGRISDGVPVDVVDALEAIEVDEEHDGGFAVRQTTQEGLRDAAERSAI